MPVESGNRPLPGQEKHAAFHAGLPALPGNNGVLGSGSGERRGSGQQGSAVNFVRGIIQQQRLYLRTISEYCTMWSDMAVQAHRTQSETVSTSIANVRWGLDYLAFTRRYDQISEDHKTFVLEDIPIILKKELHTNPIVLPYEDAKLLQLAAAGVNINYDPGGAENTPENIRKRTFDFSNMEQKIEGAEIPDSTTVVDADK